MEGAAVKWTQAARRHRIGKASARHVMAHVEPARMTTLGGASALRWVGADERGRELEIIAVEIEHSPHVGGSLDDELYLLVIHVMPTQLRG